MSGHRYRVGVEPLSGEGEGPSFEFETREDLFAIVGKIQARGRLSPEEASAFGVGLKLFSEVVLRRRSEAPFSEIMPLLGAIMGHVKPKGAKGPAKAGEAGA